MSVTAAAQLASDADLHRVAWEHGELELYLHDSQRIAWRRIWSWWPQDASAETQGQYARTFALEVSWL